MGFFQAAFDVAVVLGALPVGNGGELVSREDGDGAETKGRVLDELDDGVLGVGDEDGHGGEREERPEDEEGFAGVGNRGSVAVANGGQGDEAQVKGVVVAPSLLVLLLCLPEDEGANEPEGDPGAGGGSHGDPSTPGHGTVLDVAHELKLGLAAVILARDSRSEAVVAVVLVNRGEHLVLALLGQHANEAAAALFLHADADALPAAIENHAANGANDQTEAYDADERIREQQAAAQSCRRGKVAEADSEERHVGPVYGVQVVPALNVGKQQGA